MFLIIRDALVYIFIQDILPELFVDYVWGFDDLSGYDGLLNFHVLILDPTVFIISTHIYYNLKLRIYIYTVT